LLAVIIFFRKDILSLFRNPRLLGLVFIVTLITGVIGVSAKDFFEGLFGSAKAVGIAWLFSGLILISTKRFTQPGRHELTFKDALVLGLAQGLAIIPGISRSGITIASLFYRKIDRKLAFTLSFLVSIPVILGAAVLEARKLETVPSGDIKNLAAGFIFSFLTGLLALLFLKLVIKKAKFYYFGYYCIFMAAATLLFIK
jgi:undecaprenyl-diphosphatase